MNRKKRKILLLVLALAALMVIPSYASEWSGEGDSRDGLFGSRQDALAKGYWSDTTNLTWSWFDGGSVVIGNGPTYRELHPEATDREVLLREYVNYPGEGLANLNSWGEPKANFDEEDLALLRDFVNSFDWIHSDELTRVKAVHDRIAVGRHENTYGSSRASAGAWKVLRYQEGICVDYAGEFRRLANYVGLECEVYAPQLNHEICMVRINGQWITLDASVSNALFDNTVTVPVDFDMEHGRMEREYQESGAYRLWEAHMVLNEQFYRGEITEEEFHKKVEELYR